MTTSTTLVSEICNFICWPRPTAYPTVCNFICCPANCLSNGVQLRLLPDQLPTSRCATLSAAPANCLAVDVQLPPIPWMCRLHHFNYPLPCEIYNFVCCHGQTVAVDVRLSSLHMDTPAPTTPTSRMCNFGSYPGQLPDSPCATLKA